MFLLKFSFQQAHYNSNAPFDWGEFEGVALQVEENLLKTLLVRIYQEVVKKVHKLDSELYLVEVSFLPLNVHDLCDALPDVEGGQCHPELRGLDLSQGKHVVHRQVQQFRRRFEGVG